MMGRLRDDLPNLPVLDLGTPFWLFSGNFDSNSAHPAVTTSTSHGANSWFPVRPGMHACPNCK